MSKAAFLDWLESKGRPNPLRGMNMTAEEVRAAMERQRILMTYEGNKKANESL